MRTLDVDSFVWNSHPYKPYAGTLTKISLGGLAHIFCSNYIHTVNAYAFIVVDKKNNAPIRSCEY